MKIFVRLIGALLLLSSLISCTEKHTTAPLGILDEISGVWRASTGELLSIIYGEKKIRMLIGDNPVPVSLGAVDETNKTVNLNVALKTGKQGVWTISQVWDKEKNAFHVRLTLHDGTQDEFSFVRKISTDDVNRIANLEARSSGGSLSDVVQDASLGTASSVEPQHAESAPMTPPVDVPLVVEVPPPGIAATPITWAPSFDCTRASVDAERLICSSREVSDADVKLSRAYSDSEKISLDKATLKRSQISWMKNERDVCQDVHCLLAAYHSRFIELSHQ